MATNLSNDHDDSPATCAGCCVFPHGRRGTIWAVILSVWSYIFLCTASFGCDFMKINGSLTSEPPYVHESSLKLSNSKIGLFAFQDYGHGVGGSNFMCNPYVKPQIDAYFDGTFKLARGFAILANLCLVIASLVVLISTCASLHKSILQAAGFLFILGSVFTVLMFVFFASEAVTDEPHNGKAGWGVGFNVISMLLSALAGIITMKLQPGQTPAATNEEREIESQELPAEKEQPKKSKRVMPPGSETVEETILPDGSRKYTTTKWKKDGSSTKTEEIVRP